MTFAERAWQIVRHSQVRKFSREREISPRNAVCPSLSRALVLQIVRHSLKCENLAVNGKSAREMPFVRHFRARSEFCKLSVTIRGFFFSPLDANGLS